MDTSLMLIWICGVGHWQTWWWWAGTKHVGCIIVIVVCYVICTQLGFDFSFTHYQCTYVESILQFETHFNRTQSDVISQMLQMERVLMISAVGNSLPACHTRFCQLLITSWQIKKWKKGWQDLAKSAKISENNRCLRAHKISSTVLSVEKF